MNACAFECSGISFYPKAGLKVSLVPPQIDALRRVTVKSFSNNKIVFEEVSDKSQIQQFDGMHLLVTEDVAKELKKAECESFLGWKIVDKTSLKSLIIKKIVDMPTQQLAICDDDVQVILHDDLIDSIDKRKKTITVILPENYFNEY